MSARALRKVLKEQESANNILSVDDESSESPSDSPRPSSINPFDLLNDHEQENDSSDVDTSSTVKDEVDVPSSNKNTTTKASTTNQKSKKKKKKKKNKESRDDVILEDLSFGVNSSGGQGRVSTNILQVDPRFFRAENELRRIFGSKVVSSFEKSNQSGSSRQNHPMRRGTHTHKKTILVSPSALWPKWDVTLLSMELLENRDGCNYFRYVHSSTYNLAQQHFESAKATHDLNGIGNLLEHYPYHIDSLITIADYYKFSGEVQKSAEITAQALYGLERAWHPLFNPLNSTCQLKYQHDTNKPLFTTLFNHMKNMDRRSCHRSALEICKLLICLDSDDPMGALFCIDYFALRAGEYKWLERFSEEYNGDNSLWLYPNFSYSLAICRFYNEREEEEEEQGSGKKAGSTELMKQALMLHPSVLRKLVVKVPLKEQIWNKIVNHSFFGKDQSGSESLDHLINIYVERSYIIWRLPELHNFLKDTALLVIEKMETNASEARDWACVRKEAFASDKNEYSHLMVSDFSDSSPTIPPENLQNFLMDPRLGMGQMHHHHNAVDNQENIAGVARAPRQVANRNALAVLFESMLPWADYGAREGDEQDNED